MLHEIKYYKETGAEPEILAKRKFSEAFCLSAFAWFNTTALIYGFKTKVRDQTLAGYHYVNAKGQVLELI
jgi:hypothetical protein